ncbi:MAG: hypothetical protein ACT4NY_21845 [Pseudonocardiales bacterium]
MTRNPHHRVELTEQLYRVAAARAGIELLLIHGVRITADPDFTAAWIYVGRKHRHGHPGIRHATDGDTPRATVTG